MLLPKQDLGSLTHTRPFLGVFHVLHVPSPLSRQGLKGTPAEKSVTDLVRHTKVSSASSPGHSQNASSSTASALSPNDQRSDPWLQSLDECRCSLLSSASCGILRAQVSGEGCRAQLCVIHSPGLSLCSGPVGPNPGISAPVL